MMMMTKFSLTHSRRSWEDSAKIGSILILSNDCEEKYIKLRDDPPFTSIQLLEILKLQLPQSLSFLTRMIFYVRLDSNSKSFQCCSPISQISWMSIDELTAGKVSHVWGPELVQYAQTLKNEFEDFIEQIEEFSLDDVYLYSPRDPPRNAEETMLLELNISEKTIEILYNDFLEHCYPCFSLPIESFKNYMSKYGFNNRDQRLESLFLAFNYKRNGYVSFHELLMGLVALEPNASHQETRIKFIFRFYDFKCKGYLNKSDFERLVLDIYPTLSGLDFREKLFECLQSVDYSLIEDKIAFTNFMQAIRMHRFRGTSKLCRSVVPVFLQLTRAFIHKKKPTFEDLKEWGDLSMVLIPRTSKGKTNCVWTVTVTDNFLQASAKSVKVFRTNWQHMQSRSTLMATSVIQFECSPMSRKSNAALQILLLIHHRSVMLSSK